MVFAGFFLFGLPGVSGAASPLPLLDKVFVYAGDQKVRLVMLFDAPLDGSDPVPRLRNGTLSLFLRGARGGKPIRQFALEQGGYDRLEAREGKSGLWLTIRTKKGFASLKGIPEITLGPSALTVTLPSLKISKAAGTKTAVRKHPAAFSLTGAPSRKSSSSSSPFFGLKNSQPGKQKEAVPQSTSESILENALSSSSAGFASGPPSSNPPPPVAAKGAKTNSLTLFQKKSQGSNLFARSSGSVGEEPQLGSNVVSFSGLALKFAGALGGILVLIIGGLFFFKKLAPRAVSRLGGNGSLVRTIYKTHLAPKKSLALVEVAGEVLVLGISGQNITMLTKIENEETLARVRKAGESTFVEHLTKMISSHSKSAQKADEADLPLLIAGKDSNDAVQGDSDQVALPKKGGAALLAYARQAGPKAGGLGNGNGFSDSQGGRNEDEEPHAPSIRSAARLRQRLNRVTTQARRNKATS